MSTEVEIKFVVKSDVSNALAELLQGYEILEHAVKPLSNTYFDTNTYQFRQFDFGLRTRRSVNFAEQTIKTAGVVRGGLHQRPEYNLPLQGELPTLVDFPADIWPENTNIAQLQADLVDLFTTDFERTMWQVRLPNGAEVEVVFDQGMVRSGQHSYPICEIELELMQGSVDDLFNLAEKIAEFDGVRLGNVSKAKRGYQLAGLYAPKVHELSLSTQINQDESLAEIFLRTLAQGYQHWQHHEQVYLETQDHAALSEVLKSIALILHTLATYADVLPKIRLQQAELEWLFAQFSDIGNALKLEQVLENNGHLIRKYPDHKRLLKELSALQAACINSDEIEKLMTSVRYTKLTLAISRLLNRDSLILATTASVHEFASLHLEISWQAILNSGLADDALTAEQYMNEQAGLQYNVLVGQCFNHLFDDEMRNKFRLPWLDILQGIDDLEVIRLLRSIANMQNETIAAGMNKILLRKQASLLDALEQTRQQALMMQPYWH